MTVTLAHVAPMSPSPWGALLTGYFTLIGIPSGLTLAVAWQRTRFPQAPLSLDWRAGWATLAMLAGAGICLVVDLGRPGRFSLMLTEFGNWDSPISLGAKILAVKSFVLGTALYLLWRRRQAVRPEAPPPTPRGAAKHVDRTVTVLLVAASVSLALYPIAVLARTWVAPLAATSGSALLYLVTSLLMGAAAFHLVQASAGGPSARQLAVWRQVTFALLATYAAALALTAVSVPNGPARQALDGVLTGDGAPLFYGGAIGLGLVLPTVALVWLARVRWARLAAAASLLAGAGIARYLIFTA